MRVDKEVKCFVWVKLSIPSSLLQEQEVVSD